MSSKISKLERKPVAEVIESLERLLEIAKTGELRSFTYFAELQTDEGAGVEHDTAGTVDAPGALFAFECWKAGVIRATGMDDE